MAIGKVIVHLVQRAAIVAAIFGARKAWQLYQEQKPVKRTVSSRVRPYKIFKLPAKDYKPLNPVWLVQVVQQVPRSVDADSIIAQCPAYQELLAKLQGGWTVDFGSAAARELFELDPKVTYLNHGSYGAEFKVAGEVRQWCQRKLESEAVDFMENCFVPGVASALSEVAELVGAGWQDVVPVTNATEAVNVVAHGLSLRRGDIIVVSNITYPAVRNTLGRLAAQKELTIMEVSLSLKAQQDPKLILDAFKEAIRGGYGRIRFALLDHVSSWPPVLWPVKELCQMFAKAGAKVMVDGAHCIGNLPHLDIPSIGCQYYTTNLHKWWCTPKSAALLWVAPREQPNVLPLITSHGAGLGFRGEFLWQGTRDPTAWMAAPVSTALFKAWGLDSFLTYNSGLLQDAVALLLNAWGTSLVLGGPPKAAAQAGSEASPTEAADAGAGPCMACVELPSLLPSLPACQDSAWALYHELQDEHKIEVPVGFWEGKMWVRISAQIYNALPDYQRLADAVLSIQNVPPRVDSAL